jgi:maltose O-acetyltransferase
VTRSWKARIGRKCRSGLRTLAGSIWVPPSIRLSMLRLSGITVGRCIVRDGLRVLGDGLVVGDGVFINSDCYVEAEAPVVIEGGVSIGVGAQLLTVSHEIGAASKRAGESTFGAISLGAGCWLGARVTVLPGVRIGRGAIVGAGSVVNRDVKDNTVVAGVPARELRTLT